MNTGEKPLRVGRSEIRADARAKAEGSEPFAVDFYPPSLIWAGAVRAKLPHGRLLGLHLNEALAVPGVIRILTASDIKGPNRHGIIHKDTPVLVDDRILHGGDALALVLAENREALRQAISLVRADIEPLPAVFTIESALAQGAPLLHEKMKGNLLMAAEIRKGDAAAAFLHCDAVVEGRFYTPVQDHAFLETENGVAQVTQDGGITMTVSTQSPFRDRFEVGMALGIPYDRIHVVSPSLGGGFGGKDGATVQCLLALAALHADGRAVKMVWEREEHFLAGYKRHACHLKYRLGAGKDGVLRALDCELIYDTGAYAHLGGEVMELGMEHAGGPYRIPDLLIRGQCVFTNNPVAGAMRAFGVCQASFAFESMMDMLAQRLDLDPLEIRRRNALVDGDVNGAGVTLRHSTHILDCLDLLGDHPLWLDRQAWKEKAPPNTRRGVGLASVFNAAGYGGGVRDSAIAKVELSPLGEIIVHNAVSDMGQGNSCAFVQMAGQLLGQDGSRIKLRQPDTATAYPSGSSSAGRTTYTYGNALIKACKELGDRLINRAGLVLFLDNDAGLRLVPGKVIHADSGREVPLERLAAIMPPEDRVCISQFVSPVCDDLPRTAKGFFIGFPHVIFAYGAHLARIEVDLLSGQIRVADYLAVTDGGRVINPVMYEQQVQGGVAQGLGYALSEDVLTRNGQVLNGDFSTYLIPGSMDLPDILSIACESDEASGPFGMKGIGEVAMNGPLPALANALSDACGLRICHAPLTPVRVLAALQG
jgi:CO/xanthine dehydrogenase Mo-binding subunit